METRRPGAAAAHRGSKAEARAAQAHLTDVGARCVGGPTATGPGARGESGCHGDVSAPAAYSVSPPVVRALSCPTSGPITRASVFPYADPESLGLAGLSWPQPRTDA